MPGRVTRTVTVTRVPANIFWPCFTMPSALQVGCGCTWFAPCPAGPPPAGRCTGPSRCRPPASQAGRCVGGPKSPTVEPGLGCVPESCRLSDHWQVHPCRHSTGRPARPTVVSRGGQLVTSIDQEKDIEIGDLQLTFRRLTKRVVDSERSAAAVTGLSNLRLSS